MSRPPTTDSAAREAEILARIQAWLAQPPDAVSRGFARAVGPATRALQAALPVGALRRAVRAAEATGRRLADRRSVQRLAGVEAIEDLRQWPLADCEALARRVARRAMLAAGASGAALGIAGAPGLVADTVAVAVLALRTIHRTGLCFGFDPDPGGRTALGVFALASANTLDEKHAALLALAGSAEADLEVAAWRDGIERAAERELAKEAAVLSLNNLARQFATHLGWRKAHGLMPAIGVAVGGGVNAWYLREVAQCARHWFALCRLGRLDLVRIRTDAAD